MNKSEFIDGVVQYVIEDNQQAYRRLFKEAISKNPSDSYWRQAGVLFNSLKEEQQGIFFQIIRQVQVDTISTLFSIIDGNTFFVEKNLEFELIERSHENKLSGQLQENFLEKVENR